jgi:hypothetical protein
MAEKLYFQDYDENCYPIDYHLDYMKENNIKEMDVFKAERETGTGYFFCKEFMEIGETGESCGKMCEKYIPNNGKNGRCKHYGYVYNQTDEIKKLRIGISSNFD